MTNGLTATLQDAAQFARAEHLAFAVVGGLAVAVHAEPRFTRDVALAIAVADDNEAEAIVRAAIADGWQVVATVEQEATNRLATVRLAKPGSPYVLDLLFASSGIEPELVAAASKVEVLPGVEVPVATLGHLVTLKLLSADDRRPQDAADLQSLLANATDGDVATARAACKLVQRRGYARGRDLVAAVEQWSPPRG